MKKNRYSVVVYHSDYDEYRHTIQPQSLTRVESFCPSVSFNEFPLDNENNNNTKGKIDNHNNVNNNDIIIDSVCSALCRRQIYYNN